MGITVKVEGREGVAEKVWDLYNPVESGDHSFVVRVEFTPPLDDNTIMCVLIPAKKYTHQQFIEAVETGLADSLRYSRQEKEQRRLREQDETALKALARDVAADLGLEGPTDDRQ